MASMSLNGQMLSFPVLFLLALTKAELTCYYPDSSVATGHVPCNATASNTPNDASACCFAYGNDYCLANGLCWFDGILSRGSCTDKNWASPACSQWCLNEQQNTSMNIFPCHQQGVWQCEWHEDCVSNFTLQTPGISIIVRDDQQPGAPNAIAFADPNATFAAVDRVNNSSTEAHTSSTSSNTSSASSSVDPATPVQNPSSGLSVGSKSGIAVGAVVGALAFGIVLFVVFVRRRRRRMSGNGPGASITEVTDRRDAGHLCVSCRKAELPFEQRAPMELHDADVRPELMSQNLRWEIGAEDRGDG